VRDANRARRIAAEHARDFQRAFVTRQNANIGRCDAVGGSLLNHDVVVRTGRQLRQMCDRKHLVPSRELPERITYLLTDATTDAGIDLVEDERRDTPVGGLGACQRKHDA